MASDDTATNKSVGQSDNLGLSGTDGSEEGDWRDSDDQEVAGGESDGTESGPEVLAEPAESKALAVTGAPASGTDHDVVRFEYRCKICQLSVRLPSLYRRVHELVLRDKMSYTDAMAEVNSYIKQHNLGIKLLNMVNMSGHFSKHINISQRVALAVARSNQAPSPPPSAVRDVAPLAIKAAETDVDDFKNLDELRRRLTGVLEKLETQLENKDAATGAMKLDRWNVQLFVSIISEARACVNDLNKMRQSERLMNTVVQQLLERMTFAIIPQLLEEYKVVCDELRHAKVPDKTVDLIDERLRTKTAQIIAQTARAAVVEVQRQFKLR